MPKKSFSSLRKRGAEQLSQYGQTTLDLQDSRRATSNTYGVHRRLAKDYQDPNLWMPSRYVGALDHSYLSPAAGACAFPLRIAAETPLGHELSHGPRKPKQEIAMSSQDVTKTYQPRLTNSEVLLSNQRYRRWA